MTQQPPQTISAPASGDRPRVSERASLIERAAERLAIQDALRPPSTAEAGQMSAGVVGAPDRFPKDGRSRRQDIDFTRLERAGMVTPDADYTPLAEQFRIIKRPVLLDAFRPAAQRRANANVVMVTSARPGEGKTFVACNLALSIAQERDFGVLLVDADVRHPSVARSLGLSAERGLTDILGDPSLDPGDVMIRAGNLRNLAVIAAGRKTASAPELFASQRMARLIDDFASRYRDRITIIDTPPALASSEPSVISLHAGQTLLVVEADRTSARAVTSALSLLRQCPSISLVLNKARGALGAEEFGHYGYAYAGHEPPAAAREKA